MIAESSSAVANPDSVSWDTSCSSVRGISTLSIYKECGA